MARRISVWLFAVACVLAFTVSGWSGTESKSSGHPGRTAVHSSQGKKPTASAKATATPCAVEQSSGSASYTVESGVMSFNEDVDTTWGWMYLSAFLYAVVLPVVGWKLWTNRAPRGSEKSGLGL